MTQRTDRPVSPPDEFPTSTDRWPVAERAYHEGYFECPRRTTLTELAATFDTTSAALSRELRSELAALCRQQFENDR
jgi:hypothetical protein